MISVVIVTHDSGKDLPSCLRSLAEERSDPNREIEVVVVDNGSSDDTVELARAYGAVDRVLELGVNTGFAHACNRGVEATTGELILLLNPDARLRGGAIAALAAALRRRPDAAVAAARLISPDGRSEPVWAPEVGVLGEAVRKAIARLPGRGPRALATRLARVALPGWYTAACMLVRRDAWRPAGGFDERFFLYFEDADLGRRLRLAGWKALSPREAVVVHERSVGLRRAAERSTGPSPIELCYRRSQLLYYRLHRPRWERRVLELRLRWRYRSQPQALAQLGLVNDDLDPLRRLVWRRRVRAASREVEQAAVSGRLAEPLAERLLEHLRLTESDLRGGAGAECHGA